MERLFTKDGRSLERERFSTGHWVFGLLEKHFNRSLAFWTFGKNISTGHWVFGLLDQVRGWKRTIPIRSEGLRNTAHSPK